VRGNLTIALIRRLDQIPGGKVFWARSFGQNSWGELPREFLPAWAYLIGKLRSSTAKISTL
jgi:hypothetical protein